MGCLPTLSLLLLVSSPKHTSMKPVYILLRDAVARVVILMPTFATWLCFVGSHADTSGARVSTVSGTESTKQELLGEPPRKIKKHRHRMFIWVCMVIV